jgi:hypothetical protein
MGYMSRNWAHVLWRRADLLLNRTAPKLAGTLDQDFWCGFVLQLSQAEPFVLDSILAISTLYEHPQYLKSFGNYEAIEQPIGDGMKTPALHTTKITTLDQHHTRALKVYNRAMTGFRQAMETGRASPVHALLSCVLFICIEVIRDNVFAALGVLDHGTELLKRLSNIHLQGQEQQLLVNIKLMLARLGTLAAAFGHPHPVDVQPEFVITGQYTVFATVQDARTALYALMADSHAYIRETAAYKASLVEDEDANSTFTSTTPDSDEKLDSSSRPQDSDGSGTVATEYHTSGTDHDRLPAPVEQNLELPRHMETFMTPSDDGLSETGHTRLPATFNLRTSDGIRDQPSEDEAATQLDEIEEEDMYISLVQQDGGLDGIMRLKCNCGKGGACECYEDPSMTMSASFEKRRKRFAEDLAQNGSVITAIDLQAKQLHIEKRMGQWYDAFHWAKARLQQTEPEVVSGLLMYYHVNFVWLTTRLAPLQTVFDEYQFHFREILGHAEVYVNCKALEKLTFTFEVGAVPPLYCTAIKCRVPTLRRRALQLLAKAPRKECMWGATSTAQLAARIIEIEERGLGLSPPTWDGLNKDNSVSVVDDKLPDEDQRVHNLEVLKHLRTGGYRVQVTRFPKMDGRRKKVVETFPI